MTSTHERALIAHLIDGTALAPATARWRVTTTGKGAEARLRRTLRALAAWGAATAGADERDVLYYGAADTPVGPVLAAVGGRGLVGVSFGRSPRAFARALATRHGLRVVRADDRLGPVRRELQRYFDGALRRFALPVDLRHLSVFQRRVLAAARRIPPGRVSSYGEIARRIGRPGASRAVGQALGRNPVPIVIPCHRVVAGGGTLGGYVGGARVKRALLTLEGALQAVGT